MAREDFDKTVASAIGRHYAGYANANIRALIYAANRLEELENETSELQEAVGPLRGFAQAVLAAQATIGATEFCGGAIEQWATQYGLVEPRIALAPCASEDSGFCACLEVNGHHFPMECYRYTELLTGVEEGPSHAAAQND